MARPKKSIKGGSTGIIDTSALLNKLVAIRQEAQATDAALNAIGNKKHTISDVAEYMKLANILKDVREQIAALDDAGINVKEYRDLSNLLSRMGESANDVIDVMRELSGFEIDNIVDENAAKTQLKDLAKRAQQAFKNTPLQFELDADIFDEKDIKVQFQRVISAVTPCLKQLSTMIADVGWDKLINNTAIEKTKKQIKKGSESIVAELDADIKRFKGKKKSIDDILGSFAEIKPRKIVKGKEQSQLDELFSDFIGAKSNAPDVINTGKGGFNSMKAAANYFKLGRELKATYDAAMQNPGSAEAEYFKANQRAYEEDMDKFEQWCEAKKTALINVHNLMKLSSKQINKMISDAQAEKKTHYENVPDVEQKISAVDAAKNTIAESNKKLSVALSAIFNDIVPQIQSEGENVGNELHNAITKIFDTLKQEGIDVSVQNPLKHQQLPEGATLDDTVANGYYNNNIDMLNNLASQLRNEYSQYITLSAEEVASDFGQKVKERMLAIIKILQQNGFAAGADNGYLEELQKQQKQIQDEYNKLHDINRPFAEQIKSKREIVSKLNNALVSKYNEDDLGAANTDLGFTLKRYAAYKKNPNQDKFQTNGPVFGEHVEEQLIVAIKQAYENAIARGASAESLSKLAQDSGVDIGKLDLAGAEKIVTKERDAILEEIKTIQANAENNKKLLNAKYQELIEINKRVKTAKDEQDAAADLILNARNADAEVSDENNPPRKRGRPRKNPKPEGSGVTQGASVADAAILREEGDKIVSAINQNTDKIISVLGGENILKTLGMTSAATNDFGTANADAAEAQLKQIYSELKAYRMSRSRGKFDPLYRESKTVAYQKAYAEARRQGVSEDVLKAYKLNVTKKDYNQSLATLENGRNVSIMQTLELLSNSVNQLADSIKSADKINDTKILEAINAITEQMRVCCDNMSVMQDIKPALEPISQISNTLGEILAKVSALGGGEGTSAVDAQKEALKQNLKSYFDEVTKINQKRQPNGAINNQETGSNVYANGKVSMFYGEGGNIPGTYRLIDLLSNLESPSVMSIHSHPLADQRNRIYKRTGELWANNTFSLQDIRSAIPLKQDGVPLMGEVTGNLLRLMDISQLTTSQIRKIADNYDAAQKKLLKTHPQYFTKDQDTGEFQLKDVPDPIGHINASQLLDAALADSIKKMGVDPKSIFKTLDITSEAGIDELVNLIIEAGNTVNTVRTPFERAFQYFMGRNIPHGSIERMQNGAMTPLEVAKANLHTNMPDSKTFDISNEAPIQNLLTSISSTLQSIHQSLSAIQTVVASPQNVNREFINDVERNLDIYKYISPNTSESTHTSYANDQLYAISSHLYEDVIKNAQYARDNLYFGQNGLIDSESATNIEIYIDSLKAYLGSLQDRINNVMRDGRIEGISAEDYRRLLVSFNDARSSVANDDLVGLYKQYLDRNVGATTDLNRQSNISQTLSSILTTLQSIERAINSDTHTWDATTGEETSFTTRDASVESVSQRVADAVQVERMLNAIETPTELHGYDHGNGQNDERSTGIYTQKPDNDGNNPPPDNKDVYQLLSSNPYATEATLSKVLAKLESGIKTSGKDNTSNSKEGAKDEVKESSKKGVSLSPVRGVFKKAETIDNRVAALIAENSALKDTDEYKAYLNSSSTFKGKKEHYLKETNSDETASKRLEESNKYLASIKANEEALKKLAARQKELNTLAADPRSKIVSAETVVNAENMEQELMKAAGVVNGIDAKFTLGEKFGTATYEIKDAESHLNKMAIAYDKLNKRFIVTKKSSRAIDLTASRGSADKDEYGIKSAYMSRFKANAKLNASLNGVPAIKETQAYKDYIDAYNKMLEKKNDFFNYSNKTEEEKQELLNIALGAEEAAKNVDKLVKTQKEFEELKSRGTTLNGAAGLSGDALNSELQRLAGVTDAKKSNFKISKDKGQGIQTATYEIVDHTNKIHEMQIAYNRLTGEAVVTETRVVQSASKMGKAIDALKGKFKQVLTYIASYGSIYQLFNIIRQGITYVKDIDSALTDLKKVTNGTNAEYDQFLQDMSKTASVVGSTTQELILMSAEWARLGYNMKQAGELARTTAILLNVSEFKTAEEASQALISTIQAYGYAAEDSMHVVDILNEVGKNIAHR